MTERIQQAIEKAVDIDSLPAGWEMDALVAEKVMGWELAFELTKSVGSDCWMQWYPDRSDYEIRSSWWPSTSIAAAWEVWEWAKADEQRWRYFTEQLCLLCQDAWCPESGGDELGHLLRSLCPLAICRAALKAKEHT